MISGRAHLGSQGLEIGPDLGYERPDMGSKKPDLGSERSNLGSERPYLRFERFDWGLNQTIIFSNFECFILNLLLAPNLYL